MHHSYFLNDWGMKRVTSYMLQKAYENWRYVWAPASCCGVQLQSALHLIWGRSAQINPGFLQKNWPILVCGRPWACRASSQLCSLPGSFSDLGDDVGRISDFIWTTLYARARVVVMKSAVWIELRAGVRKQQIRLLANIKLITCVQGSC